MTRSRSAVGPIDGAYLDSVSAVIWMPGPRYLLQHREDREGVTYPNWWSLFGGGCELGETAEATLRRELLEELDFQIGDCKPLIGCTFDLWFEGLSIRKIFFTVEMTQAEADKLELREGQGMGWLSFPEIMGRADLVVPYDLGVIALHNSRVTLEASLVVRRQAAFAGRSTVPPSS